MSGVSSKFWPLAQLSGSLFGRTFILLALLVTLSLGAGFQTFLLFESQPRAIRLAQQIAALVNLTKASLEHTAIKDQQELLDDLRIHEGIHVYPRRLYDEVEPLPGTRLNQLIMGALKTKLGGPVVIAGAVNEHSGIWISFFVNETPYWLNVAGDRFEHISTLEWLGWLTITLILSLLGAGLISSVVVQPVKRLTAAASKLRSGKKPEPVPESGPREIRMLNHTFNEMVKDLQTADEQRTLMLAGISHDLRTPLARLRLEIELSASDELTRQAMVSDIEQMDKIVGQFLEFAKPSHELTYNAVCLGQWLNDTLKIYRHPEAAKDKAIQLKLHIIDEHRIIEIAPLDLSRAITNLVENARRYGIRPGEDYARVDVNAWLTNDALHIRIRDHGRGVPAHHIEKIQQPFVRLDDSRGTSGGSGLGLSIVERLMHRHQGKLTLENHRGGGLVASLWFPLRTRPITQNIYNPLETSMTTA